MAKEVAVDVADSDAVYSVPCLMTSLLIRPHASMSCKSSKDTPPAPPNVALRDDVVTAVVLSRLLFRTLKPLFPLSGADYNARPRLFARILRFRRRTDGLPLDFHLTGGEASDCPEFETSLDIGPDTQPRVAMPDKGYDSRANREAERTLRIELTRSSIARISVGAE